MHDVHMTCSICILYAHVSFQIMHVYTHPTYNVLPYIITSDRIRFVQGLQSPQGLQGTQGL